MTQTISDTLASAGPEILAMIQHGRELLSVEAAAVEAAEQNRLAEGEHLANQHWHGLQDFVEKLLPSALWPYCNTHQPIRPDNLAIWRSYTEPLWEACSQFKLLIEAPGCVPIEGRLVFDNDAWTQWNVSERGNCNGLWAVSHWGICNDDDEDTWKVYQCGHHPCRHTDNLSVALAHAADGYLDRNKLYPECEKKNAASAIKKEQREERKKPRPLTPTEKLAEALHEFIRERTTGMIAEEQ